MKKLSFIFLVLFGGALLFGALPVMAEQDHGEKAQGFLFIVDQAYIEKGVTELMLSVEYDWESNDVDTDTWAVELAAEYGFTDRIKGALEIPYEFYKENGTKENGIGDIAIVGSFAVLKQTEKSPEISLGIETTAPTGDYKKGLGNGVWGWGPLVRLSKTWEKIAIHGNLTYEIVNSAKEYEENEDVTERVDITTWVFGGAFVYMPKENVDLILELVGECETEKHGGLEHNATAMYIVPGLKYEFKSGLELGLAGTIGLTDDSYDGGVIIKAKYVF